MSVKRINDLPDGSGSLTNDDIFLFMDDPSGSGITKKISLSDISNSVQNPNAIVSDTTNIVGASGINNIVFISQANYDNIATPDSETLYFIM
jgi:hypothetical protein